jgi:L-alanine-DL-glutamate epimerase-like enolase superfamily enzyme
MPRSTDIRLKSVQTAQQRIAYRSPIKFGGRVVDDVVLFNVLVEVETRDGRHATGLGSMPMGNVWAWPSQQVSTEETLTCMIEFSKRLAATAADYSDAGHPLRITTDLSTAHHELAASLTAERKLAEPMPRLAQLVCVSPLEAAIYDAYGRALAQNSYNLLGVDYVDADLSNYLNDEFAGQYLEQYTSRQPKPKMPLYHLVGALDPLFEADVGDRLNDGLPETLGEWILADGLTHLKIKLSGDDLPWDVARVVAVEQVSQAAQAKRGCTAWHYSLDFNEKCPNVEYVLDFLRELESRSSTAMQRVQYIEQPTHRDLRAHPDNRMHAAARIKPVVIDESLVDLDSLLLAREQGYSGVALKACKGHSEALLMGAAAQKYDLFLCVQDLTCIGASFLHSASLAARVPSVAAIEGNGRQYCPAGNRDWEDGYPGMFHIIDGTVKTAELDGPGLGYSKAD